MSDIVRNREIVTLYWEPGFREGGWRFQLPDYKVAFLDALKSEIPVENRSYDPRTKHWTVCWIHGQAVAELLDEFFKADVVWVED